MYQILYRGKGGKAIVAGKEAAYCKAIISGKRETMLAGAGFQLGNF